MPQREQQSCTHKWVKNGFYATKGRGRVQRWTCNACGCHRKDFERPVSAKLLQAFALSASRLPLDQTEYLVGVKSEIISTTLMSVRADGERWAAAQKHLAEMGIDDQEIKHLGAVASVAPGRNRRSPADGLYLKGNIATLKAKIESVIGEEVVIAPSRQGVRVCRKKDYDDLIRNAKKLPGRSREYARLSPQELAVLKLLRSASSEVELLSRIFDGGETTFDPATMKQTPPEPTPTTLGMSLGLDLDEFNGIVVGLVRKLRKLVDPARHGNPGAQAT